MNPQDIGIIDRFNGAFNRVIDTGFGLIQGDVYYLYGALIIISLTLAALFWSLEENGSLMVPFLRKVLLIGFFAFLLRDWQALTQTVAASFATLGLKAGGSSMTVEQFYSPGTVAAVGVGIIDLFMGQIRKLTGPVAFFKNIADIFVISLAMIGILAAFFVLAIQIVVTVVEFKIVTLAAFPLVAFGIYSKTTFLSERALGYVASSGLKVLAMAVIVSVGQSMFGDLRPGPDPNFNEALSILLGALLLLALSISVPAVAGSLVSGGPSLGAGALAGAAIAGGTVAAGAAVGGAAAAAAPSRALASVRAAAAVPSSSSSSAASSVPAPANSNATPVKSASSIGNTLMHARSVYPSTPDSSGGMTASNTGSKEE